LILSEALRMRAASACLLSGAVLLLAGCGGATSGIVAIGPDMFAVETRGRVLANAVERGLTEATSFCMGQGRQTELLGTRINADNYQVAFRCVGASTTLVAGSSPIGRVPMASRPSALGPVPLSGAPITSGGGPLITGQAFPPAPPRQPGLEMGTVAAMPLQPAPVAGNPFAPTAPRFAPAPVPVPVQVAPVAASIPPAGFQPLQSPLTAAPAPLAPPPAAAPLSFEPPRFAEPPRSRNTRRADPVTEAPAFMPPPPDADPLQPLQSPLAGAPPMPAALPPAAPAASSPAPVFQSLPPASGLPQARSALQPVAAPR
jgi:hypothetical protein